MAQKAVTKTKVTGLSLDPVLGSDNTLISLGAKLQRQHGMALPAALTAVLTFHGLKVIREAPIPLMLTACRMASCNDIDALRKVNMPETDTIKEIYRADLVVIDPVSGYIGAFDCKRGTGNSDSSSKAHLEKKLKASLGSLVPMLTAFWPSMLTAKRPLQAIRNQIKFLPKTRLNYCCHSHANA